MICPHFGVCGGCSRQDAPYLDQLADKESIVRACFEGLLVQRWHPIFGSPDPFFYRNKMEYSFGDVRDVEILNRPKGDKTRTSPEVPAGKNVIHLGLHPKGRFAIVTPTPSCLLMSQEAQSVLAVVGRWATDHQISTYVRKSGEGDLRHLVIREGKNTHQRLVNLVARARTPQLDDLTVRLRDSGVAITSFLFSAYDGISDVAGADERRILWGDGAIQERLGAVTFTVTPASFMQTNTRAAERMIDTLKVWIQEDAPDGQRQRLIDLYCGSGAIGLNLAALFEEVIGIEIHPDAVRDARKTADDNKILNARFLEGKAEDVVVQVALRSQVAESTVVVDPPRAGLHTRLVKTLLEWGAPRLYYVSCNPETLARDLRLLVERYSIVDVQPMDFFPHTDHVETAVRLKLR